MFMSILLALFFWVAFHYLDGINRVEDAAAKTGKGLPDQLRGSPGSALPQ